VPADSTGRSPGRKARGRARSELRTEYVDIYRPARLDPAVPIEETVGAIAEMVREGYVRNIGLSEVGAEALRRAQAVHPISDLQAAIERAIPAGAASGERYAKAQLAHLDSER
jgi:aryl-alcohol dehydrogenase-like predicted oxidoreductase